MVMLIRRREEEGEIVRQEGEECVAHGLSLVAWAVPVIVDVPRVARIRSTRDAQTVTSNMLQ